MPQQKLAIVPVTLQPDHKKSSTPTFSKDSSTSICTIKTSNAEIFFHRGVDEYVIQTVMRELKNL
ncbi:hypothetical protein [Lysinibacillus antri]|uniref:Uncharacterized protein n=1 Tax=Lysinibacillus antri TaxID=2498145 RepID=A0A3S0R3V8_9BACI|nr:hypothetical protein [Lysinibacillus antri]RUL45625.1 hypothetical protein EK386_19570 [Lysinibacillus antri]